MLRRFINAHFAYSGSPEKEQRLVGFAKDDKKRPGESPESEKKQPEGAGVVSNVGSMQSVVRQHSLVTAPEAIANIPRKDAVFDMVMTAGSTELQEQLEKIARAQSINLETASKDEKESLINTLFQSPLFAAQSARIIEARLLRDEELTSIVEKKLKALSNLTESKNDIDIIILEPIAEKLRGATNDARSEITEKMIEELGLSTILQGEENQSHAADILMQMYDALKAEHKRSAMVDTEQEIDDDRPSLQTARTEYRELLTSQLDGTKEYLEASIQNAAEFLYGEFAKEHDKYTEATNEEMMKTCGVTVNGFLEAFQSSTIFAHVASRSDDRPLARNLPDTKSADYLMEAERVIRGMEHAQKSLETTSDGAFPDQPLWVKQKRLEEEHQERKAEQIGTTVRRLQEQFSEDPSGNKKALEFLKDQEEIFGAFAYGTAPLDDRVEMRRMPKQAIENVSMKLATLETQPTIFDRLDAVEKAREQKMENIELNRVRLLKKLEEAERELMKYMYQSICPVIGAADLMREKSERLRIQIKGLTGIENENDASDVLVMAEFEIQEMVKAKRLLDTLYLQDANTRYLTQDEYAAKTRAHPDSTASYDEHGQIISINISRADTEEKQQRALEHERSHAVIDILSRKTFLLPTLFTGMHERLLYLAEKKGTNLQSLIEEKAEKWQRLEGKEKDINLYDFLDELLVRYADWKQGRLKNPDTSLQELFDLMDADSRREVDGTMPKLKTVSGKVRHMTDELDGDDEDNEDADRGDAELTVTDEGNRPEDVRPEERDPQTELNMIREDMNEIHAFFDAYPRHRQNEGVLEVLDLITTQYRALQTSYEKGVDTESASYRTFLDDTKTNIKLMLKEIQNLDKHYMDLTNADPSQIFSFRKLFSNVHWVTVGDVWVMFKEAGEDIQRMWKRRGEGARAKLGKTMFGHIPKGVPFFGQLAREFEGRYQSSEQEEVGVWEKRYETVDSYSLLHDILPQSRNKDELKAITNLLTKRGRMDWNFEEYWHVLEALSDYHIPHGPCKRDIQLRDMYLQKLIANIWTDKDLFEHWKNENDSAINSGKSKFQATIDTLSATAGGLAGRLEYMLDKQIALKSGEGISKEEEINPHLYEGILHYAMKNGKMSLEDKIFYTIQGVAHGMLNIDRIKGMLGEQGGILNTFPFIDFFNSKTHADIMNMASHLGFDDKPHPRITSDYRTTEFIQTVIPNDTMARQRTRKGIKRAEEIDHEDWSGLITMMDWNDIDSVIDYWSGTRWKVTAEGIQNMYVGYNSILQTYAIKAKRAKKSGGKFRFSPNDARMLATYIAAFKHLDNIATGAQAKKDKPKLSWNIINNETPVVTPDAKYKTKHFRNSMNNFISDLTKNVGMSELRTRDGSTVSVSEYIGADRTTYTDNQNIYASTEDFVNQLTEKLVQSDNIDQVITMLAEMADLTPEQGGFIPENDEYTYENVEAARIKRLESAAA